MKVRKEGIAKIYFFIALFLQLNTVKIDLKFQSLYWKLKPFVESFEFVRFFRLVVVPIISTACVSASGHDGTYQKSKYRRDG